MKILILGGSGMLRHKLFQVLGEQHTTSATFKSERGPWTRFPMYAGVDPARLVGNVDAAQFASVTINALSENFICQEVGRDHRSNGDDDSQYFLALPLAGSLRSAGFSRAG